MPNGKWRADLSMKGERYRQVCNTVQDAKNFLDGITEELQQDTPLSFHDLNDARQARALLPPSVTLVQAVTHYNESLQNIRPLSCMEAYVRYLRDKESANLKPRSLGDIRYKVGRFAAAFPTIDIHTITAEILTEFLKNFPMSPLSRRNFRRQLSGFFEWCRHPSRLHCRTNPAAALTMPITDEQQHGILTTAELAALLEGARRYDPSMLAHIAIAAWSGARNSEIEALEWRDINFQEKRIHIAARVSKTRQQRYVELEPVLTAWLEVIEHAGRISVNANNRLPRLRKRLGMDWPRNALRNSYGSYHLALYRDAARTAENMGNSRDILFRHYRELATLEEAKAWFSLTP